MSLTDAKDLAAVLLGSAVESAEEVSASAEHRVFRITLRDLTAFLKIATKAHLEPELAALQLLGPTEVPVASVLATDLDGSQTGIPCALLRHVGGIPLSYDSPLFASSGPLLRQVHEVSVDGYGHLSANSGTPRGQERTWAEMVVGLGHRLAVGFFRPHREPAPVEIRPAQPDTIPAPLRREV